MRHSATKAAIQRVVLAGGVRTRAPLACTLTCEWLAHADLRHEYLHGGRLFCADQQVIVLVIVIYFCRQTITEMSSTSLAGYSKSTSPVALPCLVSPALVKLPQPRPHPLKSPAVPVIERDLTHPESVARGLAYINPSPPPPPPSREYPCASTTTAAPTSPLPHLSMQHFRAQYPCARTA